PLPGGHGRGRHPGGARRRTGRGHRVPTGGGVGVVTGPGGVGRRRHRGAGVGGGAAVRGGHAAPLSSGGGTVESTRVITSSGVTPSNPDSGSRMRRCVRQGRANVLMSSGTTYGRPWAAAHTREVRTSARQPRMLTPSRTSAVCRVSSAIRGMYSSTDGWIVAPAASCAISATAWVGSTGDNAGDRGREPPVARISRVWARSG